MIQQKYKITVKDAKRYVKNCDFSFVKSLCKNNLIVNSFKEVNNQNDHCYLISVGNDTLIVDMIDNILIYQK